MCDLVDLPVRYVRQVRLSWCLKRKIAKPQWGEAFRLRLDGPWLKPCLLIPKFHHCNQWTTSYYYFVITHYDFELIGIIYCKLVLYSKMTFTHGMNSLWLSTICWVRIICLLKTQSSFVLESYLSLKGKILMDDTVFYRWEYTWNEDTKVSFLYFHVEMRGVCVYKWVNVCERACAGYGCSRTNTLHGSETGGDGQLKSCCSLSQRCF